MTDPRALDPVLPARQRLERPWNDDLPPDERFAHFVKKDKIVESAVTGTPVIALCGKVWVPGRDPKKFPVCPDCKRILDEHWPSKDDGAGS